MSLLSCVVIAVGAFFVLVITLPEISALTKRALQRLVSRMRD